MITIKVRQNGSLLIEGEEVKLVDWTGAEYIVPKKPFALCRCGASKEKPFCDGSHKTTAFTPVKFEVAQPAQVALCGCKRTKNPPYCDGSHNKL